LEDVNVVKSKFNDEYTVAAALKLSLLATWSTELSASHSLTVSQSVTNSIVNSHSLTTQYTFSDCSSEIPEFSGFYSVWPIAN